jgi:microcystin-dependent protein
MAVPFLGEIRMVAFNYAPSGWALCDGQTLPIQQYSALYSLLGTYYGGNGTTTFCLPDLRSRVPLNMNAPTSLGNRAGSEKVTVIVDQIPSHSHSPQLMAANQGNAPSPQGKVFGKIASQNVYSTPTSLVDMAPQAINSGNAGNSEGHNNLQPYLVINFIIALSGIYPSRS